VQAVDQRAAQTGKNQRHQRCSVRLMLAEFQDMHHQRDHDDAAAHADEASEEPGGKTDGKAEQGVLHPLFLHRGAERLFLMKTRMQAAARKRRKDAENADDGQDGEDQPGTFQKEPAVFV